MSDGEEKITLHLLIDKVETEVEVPVYMVAKHITEEQFADFLDDYENKFSNEYEEGKRIGRLLQHHHRTLQGSIIRLCLGIVAGMGEAKYFDRRNEAGVALGKKLAEMIESGELNYGPYI